MMILSIIMLIIVLFTLYALLSATHDSKSLTNKSYCIGGGMFIFSILSIFPESFVIWGAFLFLAAYFNFFNLNQRKARMLVAISLTLILSVSSTKLLLFLILPELFDLGMYIYKKYFTKNKAELVFPNLKTEDQINAYNGLNICMFFFSLSVMNEQLIFPVFIICLLLNLYFYKRIQDIRNKKSTKNTK